MKILLFGMLFLMLAAVPVQAESGLVGFYGEYALAGDNSPVSVIVLFENAPAAVQVHESEFFLPFAAAEQNIENDHELFRAELSALFGMRRTAAPYEITQEYRYTLNGVAITLPSNMVAEIANFYSVRAVFPDMEIVPLFAPANPISVRNPPGVRNGRAAMGADVMHAAGYRGEGLLIAIIDSGIYYNHAAFAGAFPTLEEMQMRGAPITAEDLLGGVYVGRNFNPDGTATNRPIDNAAGWRGHGTHVAGIAAGRDSGGANSILGVAPGARIIAYRVAGGVGANSSHLAAAIERTAIDRPDIVNMSLGLANNNDPANLLAVQVNNAMIANPHMTFVASSGNTAAARNVGSPGTSSKAITVGSVGLTAENGGFNKSLAANSSRGPLNTTFDISPDILAHGVSVHSAFPPFVSASGYGSSSGTSQAAPHIAGAAALLKQFSRENAGGAWTSAEIKTRMMNTAIHVPPGTLNRGVNDKGAGFANVYAAAHACTVVFAAHNRVTTVAGSFAQNTLETTQTGAFSFGGTANLTADFSQSLVGVISNRSAVPRLYEFSHRFTQNPGGGFLALPRQIIVPQGGESTFAVGLSVCRACATPGFYEGYIYVSHGGNIAARLPFAYVAMAVTPGGICICPVICPDCDSYPCECFGPVPPSGVPDITRMILAMFALAAVSIDLWAFLLRRCGGK